MEEQERAGASILPSAVCRQPPGASCGFLRGREPALDMERWRQWQVQVLTMNAMHVRRHRQRT